MGKLSKTRGSNFEYRVRDFFIGRGWDAIRIPLSGASEQITKEMGALDVRASYPSKKKSLTLYCECKKTGSEVSMTLQRIWLEDLDTSKGEIFVFALHKTSLYTIMDIEYYCSVCGNKFVDLTYYKGLGTKKSHKLLYEELGNVPILFTWSGRTYVIDYLENIVKGFEEKY